jgi:hypothetical protein
LLVWDMVRGEGRLTSEHLFALLVVHDGARLEVLCFEPVCDGERFGLWRAGLDRLLFLLLLLLLGFLLRLHLRLHLRLLLGHGLFPHFLHKFLNRDALLLCFGGKLLLNMLDLFGRGSLAVRALNVELDAVRWGTTLRRRALWWWTVCAHLGSVVGIAGEGEWLRG